MKPSSVLACLSCASNSGALQGSFCANTIIQNIDILSIAHEYCLCIIFFCMFVLIPSSKMQIFFPLFMNGYYFVVCFNFLTKKVEIMHSVSHNNAGNDAILVGVSLLVIFLFFFLSHFSVCLIIYHSKST